MSNAAILLPLIRVSAEIRTKWSWTRGHTFESFIMRILYIQAICLACKSEICGWKMWISIRIFSFFPKARDLPCSSVSKSFLCLTRSLEKWQTHWFCIGIVEVYGIFQVENCIAMVVRCVGELWVHLHWGDLENKVRYVIKTCLKIKKWSFTSKSCANSSAVVKSKLSSPVATWKELAFTLNRHFWLTFRPSLQAVLITFLKDHA